MIREKNSWENASFERSHSFVSSVRLSPIGRSVAWEPSMPGGIGSRADMHARDQFE